MRNRQPTKILENGAVRYAVYDEAGAFLRHEYMLPDDEPTDEGTILAKETLLRDSTESALFGDARDRTVDEAFLGVANKINLIMGDMAQITVTLKDQSGKPATNVLVAGIADADGNDVYTNTSGVASGYVSEGSVTLSVSQYADIADYSETFTAVKGEVLTKSITVTRRNFLKLTSSKSIKFSGDVTRVDVTAVGGGGGGGASGGYDWYKAGGGGGGGGGSCVVKESVAFSANALYKAVVGSGGAMNGGDGGLSSFLGVEADGGVGGGDARYQQYGNCYGGAGGSGNGAGGSGAALNYSSENDLAGGSGVAGSVAGYSSFTETVLYGGGGGGGGAAHELYGNAIGGNGAGYGGNGAQVKSATSTTAKAGTNGYGGGGGGSSRIVYEEEGFRKTRYGESAKGGSGCVAIRMHGVAA